MIKKIIILHVWLFFAYQSFGQVDSLASDSLLLLQLQSQLQNNQPIPVQTRTAPSSNPDISVIGDFRTTYQDNQTRHFDANLAETEFSFQSVIDPYARADFFYSVSRDAASGEFKGEIEEGYLSTISLPFHLQLKAGKFKQQLGRINSRHNHALSFIDKPNAFVRFFGEEGMNDEGFSLSWLLPNRVFFQELTVEETDGPRESPSFSRSNRSRYLTLVHLKNFWDLSANATLELGLTGINGANYTENSTQIGAVDITYKWKPVQMNTYKSFTFQNELYVSRAKFDSTEINALGFYSLASVQIAKRWFLTGRYDYTNKPSSAKFVEQAYSATLGWYATEFQKIELQGKFTSANEADEENNYKKEFSQVLLRWVFVIGSHGAHQY